MRFSPKDILRGGLVKPLSLNRYAYVRNDLINKIDPSGMRPAEEGDAKRYFVEQTLKNKAKAISAAAAAGTVTEAQLDNWAKYCQDNYENLPPDVRAAYDEAKHSGGGSAAARNMAMLHACRSLSDKQLETPEEQEERRKRAEEEIRAIMFGGSPELFGDPPRIDMLEVVLGGKKYLLIGDSAKAFTAAANDFFDHNGKPLQFHLPFLPDKITDVSYETKPAARGEQLAHAGWFGIQMVAESSSQVGEMAELALMMYLGAQFPIADAVDAGLQLASSHIESKEPDVYDVNRNTLALKMEKGSTTAIQYYSFDTPISHPVENPGTIGLGTFYFYSNGESAYTDQTYIVK